MPARPDGRSADALRPLRFTRGFLQRAPASTLVEMGGTRILCTATFVDGVPPFLIGKKRGWLTAEYNMLPASTPQRKSRDRNGKIDGRSTEIQRLIGRALRAVVDLSAISERTIWIDCDVLEADGGTRTASINGAWVALHDALRHLDAERGTKSLERLKPLAAVSVGIVGGEPRLDLCYAEDADADADMNLVMTSPEEFLELQGGGEKLPFGPSALARLVELGQSGVRTILAAQREALGLPPRS
jgi:ribonuclease PH